MIARGLSNYLESKREYFARFYFLSNEEIIEIRGQMREPRNIQRFLNKIFEGINNLSFLPTLKINALHSREGETVSLPIVGRALTSFFNPLCRSSSNGSFQRTRARRINRKTCSSRCRRARSRIRRRTNAKARSTWRTTLGA